MSLLPASASFEELVQDCFLAHRGTGLMLSALDMDLLSRWAEARVPFEVVARGIRRAAETKMWDNRPGEPALRSLRACRRFVDAEIRKYTARAAGRTGAKEEPSSPAVRAPEAPADAGPSWVEQRHQRMRAFLRKVAKEHAALTVVAGRLLARLRAPAPDPAGCERQEQLVRAALLRGLSFTERRAILREAARMAQNGPGISARARVLSRRFHRGAVLWKRLQLPAL